MPVTATAKYFQLQDVEFEYFRKLFISETGNPIQIGTAADRKRPEKDANGKKRAKRGREKEEEVETSFG